MKKILILSLLLLLNIALNASDYVAYSVSSRGDTKPLPENIEKVKDKFLQQIEWGNYNGPKTRLTVLQVENKTNAASLQGDYSKINPENLSENIEGNINFSFGLENVPVAGIRAMIVTLLNNTNRFIMVERQEIKDVLGEQDLGASNRVTKESAAKIGKVLGAQIQLKCEVTEYTPDAKKSNLALGSLLGDGLLGGLGFSKNTALVALNIRLIDANTSEIIFSKQVTGTASKTGFGLAGAADKAGGVFSTASKTQIGQAVIVACNKAVLELVKQIGARPWEGAIIDNKAGKIYLNGGSNVLETGEELTAYSRGEELIDPETGLSLGTEDIKLGKLEVIQTSDKFSIANAKDFEQSKLKKGDKVVSDKQPKELRFAEKW